MTRFSNDPAMLLDTASRFVASIVQNEEVKIGGLTHPVYQRMQENWEKWRRTYQAGHEFVERYLEKFSKRESEPEFQTRQKISYAAAFAKSSVNEVKDALFQRLPNVSRSDGPESWVKAIAGNAGGVDNMGATMNGFVGTEILPELLSMGKVGVCVDAPASRGDTMAETSGHPYVYTYRAEDIRNWVWMSTGDTMQLKSLLLRDVVHEVDEMTGLPKGTRERYRLYWMVGEQVVCQFFDHESKPEGPPHLLEVERIPFVLFELSSSLMADVADYQIALTNLESADLSYSLKANVPFYTEQFNPMVESPFIRPSGRNEATGTAQDEGGEASDAMLAKTHEARLGTANARRYPLNLDRPGFIHPSSEPIKASMAKGEALKRDIRLLVKLAVQGMSPQRESANSKALDDRQLQAGLSAIGLVLENGERQIADLWATYEDGKPAEIRYPVKYDLTSDAQRREDNKTLKENMTLPSITLRRESAKQIATNSLGDKVPQATIEAIHGELDAAKVFAAPEEMVKDIKDGILSLETAAKAKQYPAGEPAKAEKDHAKRVARIVQSQASARGASELGGTADASKEEKDNDTLDKAGKE